MRHASAIIVVLALLTAGCGEQEGHEIPLPPTPVPASIAETFTGTHGVQNSGSHNFVVAVASRLAITLTSLPGASCFVVDDLGNLTDPVDHTVTVAHS